MLQAIFEGATRSRRTRRAPTAPRSARPCTRSRGPTRPIGEKYYRVVTETDKQGQEVELGGSSVNNLADCLLAFGLARLGQPVRRDLHRLRRHRRAQYPEIVPGYPPVREILDTSYVKAVAKRARPADHDHGHRQGDARYETSGPSATWSAVGPGTSASIRATPPSRPRRSATWSAWAATFSSRAARSSRYTGIPTTWEPLVEHGAVRGAGFRGEALAGEAVPGELPPGADAGLRARLDQPRRAQQHAPGRAQNRRVELSSSMGRAKTEPPPLSRERGGAEVRETSDEPHNG